MNFTMLDWAIVLLYMAFATGAGIIARKYVGNLSDYLVAGRELKTFLAIATLSSTELGLVTVMYYAELGYVTGFACFITGLTSCFGYTFIGKTGFIIARLRRLRIMTVPEFYEIRYGRGVRWIGGVILAIGGILNMGIFLKFGAIFVAHVTGIPGQYLNLVMTVMLIIVLLYTVLGGMVSVVLTDYVQYVVISFSALLATIFALNAAGIHRLVDVVAQMGSAGVNPVANPRFGWPFVLWMIFGSLTAALWQPGTMRALSVANPEVGKKVYTWTGLTFAGRAIIPMLWGVAALTYLGPNADKTEAMPMFLGQVIPTGLIGLLAAGMIAAFMSTHDSYLLAWSAVITQDIIGPLCKGGLSTKSRILLTRIFVVLIGIFLLIWGLWYRIPETAFQYLVITGTMYSAGAFGCVVAGLYWRPANVVGGYAAIILGALAPIGFLVLNAHPDAVPGFLKFLTNVNISGFISFILAGLGMVLGSLLTARTHPPIALKYPESK